MDSDAASARRPLPELMDDPALGWQETERALDDLDRVTRWSLGARPVLRALLPGILAGPPRQRLLDLGTGSGLVPAALAAAAARRGVELIVVGSDRKLAHLVHGRRRGHRQLRVVAAAQALPFRDDAVDWSLSTLLLHHFDETGNRRVLAEMRRVARRGAAIVDLRPSRLAPRLFRVLAALLGLGPVARYDGLVSLGQAWSESELRRLVAGLPVLELRRRFPFRVSLLIGAARAPGAASRADG